MLAGPRKLAVIMRKPEFEELEYHETPLGELILRWRTIPSLNHQEVFEVKLDGEFLMSSLNNTTEIALAEIPLGQLGSGPYDVLVGGLGLGYTAKAALDQENVASVTVIEMLPEVINWHRKDLLPLGNTLSQDERCRLVQGDFFQWVLKQWNPDGLDLPEKFRVILIDIDHSPEFLISPASKPFYEKAGLHRLCRHLLPDGVVALWSADPPEDSFLAELRKVFQQVDTHEVEFYNPFFYRQDAYTIYVAKI